MVRADVHHHARTAIAEHRMDELYLIEIRTTESPDDLPQEIKQARDR